METEKDTVMLYVTLKENGFKPVVLGGLGAPVKWLGVVLVASSLAACGGGDGGDPAPGGDAGANATGLTVRSLDPVTLDSEETAVLMAPGSLFYQTVGMTQGVLATFDPLAGYEQAGVDTSCDIRGQIRVVGSDLEDVSSPYTGALFNTVTTDDQDCLAGDTEGGPMNLQVHTDGVRTIGRPQTGVGAVGDENTFIAFEQSGASPSDPYGVVMSMDGERLFGWARLWTGHVTLERGAGEYSAMGDAGGMSQMYQLSQVATGEGVEAMRYNLQIGRPDVLMDYGYQVAEGDEPYNARSETYVGTYGWEWDTFGGQPAPATCPGGRVDVSADLYVQALPEGQDGILVTSDEVMLGTVVMKDASGNTAVVSYDGTADVVTVALNGELGKSFSYEDINNLFIERCVVAQ